MITVGTTVPEAWYDPLLTREKAAVLLTQPGHIMVSCPQGHLLGRAGSGDMADVLTLYVQPEARRSGVGNQLFAAFLEHARTQSCAGLTLEVRASNIPAISLYARHGLTEGARRKGYYTGPLEDAVIMTTTFAGA